MKKITLIISLLFVGFLAWYFFVKPYDYLVTLKVKTFPGTINQSIKTWNLSLDKSSISISDDLLILDQTVKYNDSVFLYHWKIEAINDSTSLIKVYVTDETHSFKNRLSYPFSHTDFEKRVKNSLTDFNDNLKEHISRFKVKIEGESEIKAVFCAFIRINGSQGEKAVGMMKNIGILTNTLVQNNIELSGMPFIDVTNWDMANDLITYDFCYPIKETDSLFEHPIISFKKVKRTKALKAIYNGNYITSDRAWYALIDFANKNNIAIEKKPLEVFYNNPNMGGEELQWKAEIYMPISN